MEREDDSAPLAAARAGAGSEDGASGRKAPQPGGSVGGLEEESAGPAAAAAAAAVLTSPVGVGGGIVNDTSAGHGVANYMDMGTGDDRLEEPLGGLDAVGPAATGTEGEASPPSPSSPGGPRIGRADEGNKGRVLVEPLDRAGACGLWLRLVIMPLVVECLEGSYRTKLLALHMAQVGRAPPVYSSVDFPLPLSLACQGEAERAMAP